MSSRRRSTPVSSKPPIALIGTSEDVERLEKQHGIKTTSPVTLTPKQREAIIRTEHIIGVGGGKYSGKTYLGIIWLISGNKHPDDCGYRRGLACDCIYPDMNPDGSANMVNRSYIYHPKFLGCVLRKNLVDLRDWIREARLIYEPVGGEFKEGEKVFVFPSGAQIFCAHYDEEDAFTKFAGLNIVRFLVEEATHIPNVKRRIQMLRSCNRATIGSGMVAQMMLTFNPGGVSHGDILDMFVKPHDENGEIIPPGTPITEEYDANEIYARLGVPKPPDVGDKIVSRRVFIFSTVKDNPNALHNTDYLAALMDLPEEEREAYLFGNWEIMSGLYFPSYRPQGPNVGEPKEANHVVPQNLAMSHIQPWWWATAAVDWGWTHACVFTLAFHDQERDQLWVTEEMCVNETEPDVVGEEIGRRLKPVLARYQEFGQDPMVTLGLSHDAYGLRQDDRSVAELIGRGIGHILGPNMVHLPDLIVDKLRDQMQDAGDSVATQAADDMFNRIRSQRNMGVTIRRMRDSRIVGWQLIRSLLRWKSSLPEIKDLFDPNIASKLAYERGIEAYNAYLAVFTQKREILPKLQIVGPPAVCSKCASHQIVSISDYRVLCESCGRECHIGNLRPVKGSGLGCPGLIAAIPKAIHDPLNPEDVTKKHVEGASDFWDSLRMLAMAFRSQTMPEPFEAIRRRRIASAKAHSPKIDAGDLVHLNRKIEADWKNKNRSGQAISVVRPGRMTRARVRGLLGPTV